MILLVALVPQRQVAQHLLDVRRVGRPAEQAAAEADRRPDRLERVGGQLLRHQADLGARRAVVAQRCRGRRPAPCPDVGVTMPQTMLISVVLPAPFGPEQREDLALADLEVDALQRREARGVGLVEIADGQRGRRVSSSKGSLRAGGG